MIVRRVFAGRQKRDSTARGEPEGLRGPAPSRRSGATGGRPTRTVASIVVTGFVGTLLASTTGQAGAASQPGIAIAKSASVSSYSADTPITYTYVVLNTGSQAFDNVTVTDPMKGLSDISCDGGTNVIPTLNAFQSAKCAAAYTTTQSD